MIRKFLICFILITAPSLYAGTPYDIRPLTDPEEIARAKSALKESTALLNKIYSESHSSISSTFDQIFPQGEIYNFKTLKSILAKNLDSFYLYQSENGKLPNLSILKMEIYLSDYYHSKIEYTSPIDESSDETKKSKAIRKLRERQFETIHHELTRIVGDFFCDFKKFNQNAIRSGYADQAILGKLFEINRLQLEQIMDAVADFGYYSKSEDLKFLLNKSDLLTSWKSFQLHNHMRDQLIKELPHEIQESWQEIYNHFAAEVDQLLQIAQAIPLGDSVQVNSPSVFYSRKQSFGNFNSLLSEIETFGKQWERIHGIFEETKKEFLNQLEKDSDLFAPGQKESLITRIETVKLKSFEDHKECVQGSPAFYSHGDHHVRICPSLMEIPESSLIFVFAHELAHSIDPCLVSFDLKQRNDRHFIDFKEERGDSRSKSISSFIGHSNNPYREKIQELSERLQAPVTERDPFIASLEDSLKRREAEGETEDFIEVRMLKRALEDPQLTFDRHGGCFKLPGSSDGFQGAQTQEIFCDWMGARVVGAFIQKEEDPAKKRQIAIESSLGLILLEFRTEEAPKGSIVDQIKNKIKAINNNQEDDKESQASEKDISKDPFEFHRTHPETELRIDQILLKSKEVAEALNPVVGLGLRDKTQENP